MRTYSTPEQAKAAAIRQDDAKWLLHIDGKKPILFIANQAIWDGYDMNVFEQAVNAAEAPGVLQLVVSADSHSGYGAPVGSIMVTKDYVYPGMIGPDISCSMSYLQTDLPDTAIADKAVRRALMNAINQRIPTGANNRQGMKARKVDPALLFRTATEGAQGDILEGLGIPRGWGDHTERKSHGNINTLMDRLNRHDDFIRSKMNQLGSLGAGNHFYEAQVVDVKDDMRDIAVHFGIKHGCVGALGHCGSRGFGFQLAARHFKGLEQHFSKWGIPLPGGEKELVYAPIDSPEGQAYLADMYLGANFAIVNHLLINAYVLEAFQEVMPGTKGNLVYHISHNIGQEEIVGNSKAWTFRKGATRAFPAGHHALKGTMYQDTGHPILLPGNPESGSRIMVGLDGAVNTCYSINHGAGRAMGRNAAKRALKQTVVDEGLAAADILHNGRNYPIDEAPAAYKDFNQVCDSVEQARLAKTVAVLRARFVIKDNDQSAEGAA